MNPLNKIADAFGYVPKGQHTVLRLKYEMLGQAYARAYEALEYIAAQDTPRGNATVKRITRIAKQLTGENK